MLPVTRILHRLFNVHRLESCTLTDLRRDVWKGRMCRCGFIDEDSWELVGTTIEPIRVGAQETWMAHCDVQRSGS